MTDIHKNTKRVHPGVAAAAGVVIGAAGAAMAAALVNEQTRKKMGKKMQDLQKSTKPMLRKAQNTMKDMTGSLQDAFHMEKQEIQENTDTALHEASKPYHPVSSK